MLAAEAMAISPPIEKEPIPVLDFAALVAAEQGTLLRLALRFLRDPEEARDVVQSTFADAYERLSLLRDPAAAPGWLRRILVTRALNHLRRRRLWRRIRGIFAGGGEAGLESVSADPDPDDSLTRSNRLAAVGRALEALPPRQAAAFTLRYLEGLGLDAVAETLGCGRGTARTHLHRALTSLRSELGDREGSRP